MEGLFVPLVTPFSADGSAVDLDALARLAREVLEDGAQGIVALATTAEASSLDEAERQAVLAVCSDVCAAAGVPLVVGAGTNDTRTTIARHRSLAEVPAVVASLAVVPYYVRPSEAGIVAHFRTVAEASPVPVCVYNIPYRTGRGLGAASLLELAGVDGIVGVKQAVGAVDADTLELLAAAPAGFSVLAGDDAFIAPLLLMGGAGAITASAHLETARFARMVAAARAGDAATARAEAEHLLPLVQALFAEPSPSVLKGVLADQGRIPSAAVRLPLAPASPGAVRRATAGG